MKDTANTVCEKDVEEMLQEALENVELDANYRPRVSTFEEAGMLTCNKGLVLRVGRQEFQITIVQSR